MRTCVGVYACAALRVRGRPRAFMFFVGCTPTSLSLSLSLSPIPRRSSPLLPLQGVVAFLQGDSGKASGLLIRASAEAKSLKPNPALASRLMQQWHAVKFEVLQPKVRARPETVASSASTRGWGRGVVRFNIGREPQRSCLSCGLPWARQ